MPAPLPVISFRSMVASGASRRWIPKALSCTWRSVSRTRAAPSTSSPASWGSSTSVIARSRMSTSSATTSTWPTTVVVSLPAPETTRPGRVTTKPAWRPGSNSIRPVPDSIARRGVRHGSPAVPAASSSPSTATQPIAGASAGDGESRRVPGAAGAGDSAADQEGRRSRRRRPARVRRPPQERQGSAPQRAGPAAYAGWRAASHRWNVRSSGCGRRTAAAA